MKKLTDMIDQLILARVDEISDMIINNDSVYKNLSMEFQEAYKSVEAALPKINAIKLLDTYDSAEATAETYMLEETYKQAFRDGIEFYIKCIQNGY